MQGKLASSFDTSHRRIQSVILIRRKKWKQFFSIYWSHYKVWFGECTFLFHHIGAKHLQHGFYWVSLFALNTAVLAHWLIFKEFNSCKWVVLGWCKIRVSWINMVMSHLIDVNRFSLYLNWTQCFMYRSFYLIYIPLWIGILCSTTPVMFIFFLLMSNFPNYV